MRRLSAQRRIRIAAFLSLLLGILGTAGPAATPPPKDLERAVDEYLQPYVRLHAYSGVVLIARGDDPLVHKAYGMANYEFGVPNRTDTRFAIASISKRFTRIVLERLAEEKKLSDSDKLARWVPDFPSADRITIGELAGHTSGVRDPDKLRRTIRLSRTPGETVEILKHEPLGSEPGAVYSYTTANYAILAYVIERVTGRSYPEVVSEYVYRPAGMTDSGELATTTVVPRLATGYMPDPFSDGVSVCGPEDASWKLGGGASYSTARDLLRFARALYGGKLLGAKRAADLFPHATLLGRRSLSSSGSFPGAGANLLTFPDEGVTVVVLSNNYSTVPSAITRDLAALFFGERVESPDVELEPHPKPIDSRFLADYEVIGRPWTLTVALREGRPLLVNNEIRQSGLRRIDADTWFSPLDWAKLKLRFREDGSFEGSFQLRGDEPLPLKRK
ncbi:MAG TPA: serine hydrolase domain-containing protein [Thermoanaerobaculia bacterium]